MKTLKLAFIALLVSSSALVLAHEDMKVSAKKTQEMKSDAIKVARVSIEQAANIPGLVHQIYLQVNQNNIIYGPTSGYILAEVMHNHTSYIIYGTYDQWMLFFRKDSLPPVYIDPEKR